MSLKILHLNIEGNKHLDAVRKLLQEIQPDIACFEEAMKNEIEKLAKDAGYELIFAPSLGIKDGDLIDKEGPAILSRLKINSEDILRYDGNGLEELPIFNKEYLDSTYGKRLKERFSFFAPLVVINVQVGNKNVNICTAHFPVIDHNLPGEENHFQKDPEYIKEFLILSGYFDRMLALIKGINNPIVFTSDLNNPRGEQIYDALAEELIDIVPKDLISSIDPKLHRNPNLQLMVDTIMTSSDVVVESFEVLEGVSDHKGFIATLKI